MLKSFKKTIDDGYFSFIIVDAINDKIKKFEEFWSYAKSKGFQVYIAEVHAEASVCAKRNTHNRSYNEIQKVIDGWDTLPSHFIGLDIRPILQDAAITEVCYRFK
jgi:YLP motif-containing protein 1